MGTTWISQLGYGETEVREIATIIAEICKGIKPFRFYGPRRETLGGKISEELLQSTSQRVSEILKKSNEYIPNTFPEKGREGRNYAKAQQVLLAIDKVKIWDLRNWTEALIVMGERSASFLQSIITRDIYDLKKGEVFSALVLNANGEKRLNVLVCSLSNESHPRFLLVYQRSPETNFCDWLHMLSDGFVEKVFQNSGPNSIKGKSNKNEQKEPRERTKTM